MRTTLNIDDDVLSVARAQAKRERRSVGAVVSELARASLPEIAAIKTRNGVPLLPISNPHAVVTTELVLKLIEEADDEEAREAALFASGRTV